ncbi:MAG: phospholipid carrier-dependent glycosyltransferase [Trebonia sp.]
MATAWNLEGFPGRVDDDEGTYVSQAWAVIYTHTLTHYSYWYDHPPLGWIQIAAFAWITDGFNRVADAVYVGREFMWLLTLAGCVLVYVLCRRLGLRQATSAVAVLLFGLSPIAQYFHRMVSLDNIETVWVLAALVAATSARTGMGPALRTGICTAFAVLSKETAIIFLPVIVWVLWQHLVTPAAAPSTTTDAAAAVVTGGASPPAADTAGVAGIAPVNAAGSDADAPVWLPDFSGQWQAWAAGRRARAARRGDGQRRARRGLRARAAAPPSRAARFRVFTVALCVMVVLYPLYAFQRGQLLLWWSTLKWQFFGRPGSGSLLNTGSTTYSMFHQWVTTDPWLLIGGFVAALLALFSRRLRPFGAALLLQAIIPIHGGYLPFFYVTAVVPFAAVCIAGVADSLWAKTDLSRVLRGAAAGVGGRAGRCAPYLGRAVTAGAALLLAGYVLPQWVGYLDRNSTASGNVPYLKAAAWAEHNVPKGDVVVVDDYLWVDLKTHGLDPLWLWKIDAATAPGWQSITYIIIQPQSPGTLASLPSLRGAYAHSVLVQNFGGGLTARRVIDTG